MNLSHLPIRWLILLILVVSNLVVVIGDGAGGTNHHIWDWREKHRRRRIFLADREARKVALYKDEREFGYNTIEAINNSIDENDDVEDDDVENGHNIALVEISKTKIEDGQDNDEKEEKDLPKLNVSAKDSPYALIDKFFPEREETHRRMENQFVERYRSGQVQEDIGALEPEDVWLADGDLLVLKGGSTINRSGFDNPWEPLDDYQAPYREPKLPPPDFIPDDIGVGVPLLPDDEEENEDEDPYLVLHPFDNDDEDFRKEKDEEENVDITNEIRDLPIRFKDKRPNPFEINLNLHAKTRKQPPPIRHNPLFDQVQLSPKPLQLQPGFELPRDSKRNPFELPGDGIKRNPFELPGDGVKRNPFELPGDSFDVEKYIHDMENFHSIRQAQLRQHHEDILAKVAVTPIPSGAVAPALLPQKQEQELLPPPPPPPPPPRRIKISKHFNKFSKLNNKIESVTAKGVINNREEKSRTFAPPLPLTSPSLPAPYNQTTAIPALLQRNPISAHFVSTKSPHSYSYSYVSTTEGENNNSEQYSYSTIRPSPQISTVKPFQISTVKPFKFSTTHRSTQPPTFRSAPIPNRTFPRKFPPSRFFTTPTPSIREIPINHPSPISRDIPINHSTSRPSLIFDNNHPINNEILDPEPPSPHIEFGKKLPSLNDNEISSNILSENEHKSLFPEKLDNSIYKNFRKPRVNNPHPIYRKRLPHHYGKRTHKNNYHKNNYHQLLSRIHNPIISRARSTTVSPPRNAKRQPSNDLSNKNPSPNQIRSLQGPTLNHIRSLTLRKPRLLLPSHYDNFDEIENKNDNVKEPIRRNGDRFVTFYRGNSNGKAWGYSYRL